MAISKVVRDDSATSWYRPGKEIMEFHASRARLRAVIGGRGCGKTTSVAVEVCGHGIHNAGAKIYILRKTQDSNEDTTQETFEKHVFPRMGTSFIDDGASLFKKIEGGRQFRIPSRYASEEFARWNSEHPRATKSEKLRWIDSVGDRLCSYIIFSGVPTEGHRATRFRGFECSLLVFIEADQLTKEDLDMASACLRWKGADPRTCDERGFIKDTGIILDTNPPGPKHWIALRERDAREFEASRIAKGIPLSDLEREVFWHIPTESNRHNLPPGYIEGLQRQWRKNPAMYKRMLLGEYADAFDGSPVFYGFSEDNVGEDLGFPKGAYLVRGWDFGTTHAVVWSAYWETGGQEYWWDLYEYFAEQCDVERQCRTVLEITDKVFPFWNDRAMCSGVKDYCDPAGNAVKDTGKSIAVLNNYRVFPGFKRTTLPESISIYNRLLESRDSKGNACYKIDKNTCSMLYTASIGGYRYPSLGEVGHGSDQPLKGDAGGNFDHIADASRYAKVNCLRLIPQEVAAMNATVGRAWSPVKPNGARRYY